MQARVTYKDGHTEIVEAHHYDVNYGRFVTFFRGTGEKREEFGETADVYRPYVSIASKLVSKVEVVEA